MEKKKGRKRETTTPLEWKRLETGNRITPGVSYETDPRGLLQKSVRGNNSEEVDERERERKVGDSKSRWKRNSCGRTAMKFTRRKEGKKGFSSLFFYFERKSGVRFSVESNTTTRDVSWQTGNLRSGSRSNSRYITSD